LDSGAQNLRGAGIGRAAIAQPASPFVGKTAFFRVGTLLASSEFAIIRPPQVSADGETQRPDNNPTKEENDR
jgi:hypothetical protein